MSPPKKLKDLPGWEAEYEDALKEMGVKSVQDLERAFQDDDKVDLLLEVLDTDTFDAWEETLSGDVEIIEEEDEVEDAVYVPKAKPELDDDTKAMLEQRAVEDSKRPAFKRQEWFRYQKLGDSWRKPKGLHSKMRRKIGYRPPCVSIGYRGPKDVRGLHPSGFEEVMVYNPADLEGIDGKTQAARIGGSVGYRKRLTIEERADELGIRVLNRTG